MIPMNDRRQPPHPTVFCPSSLAGSPSPLPPLVMVAPGRCSGGGGGGRSRRRRCRWALLAAVAVLEASASLGPMGSGCAWAFSTAGSPPPSLRHAPAAGRPVVPSPRAGTGPSLLFLQDVTTLSLEWTEYFAPAATATSAAGGGHRHGPPLQHAPVLLLHGLLGSKRNFATLGGVLGVQLDKPRQILGVDLRNHGDTQPWSSEMSYRSMARDVVQFLDDRRIDRAVLVGHSMGGKVAQALALLHPERVDGLVVLDIAPVRYCREEDPNWKAIEDILHSILYVVENAGEVAATKQEIDKLLRPSIPDPALRAFVLTNFDNRSRQWKIPIATLVDELEQIAGFDIAPSSSSASASSSGSSYDGDVFIIHGGQSRFVRHAYMDTIAQYFPNHMLTTIRGAGHWVHAEAPDDTVALLKRYLDR